ncbi:MHYT domain-containing protein [Sulfitobacter faviae]|uniref:sensor histidine kinase n=2 Tax=Sulfitobacter TaxID=60136 RepID=UPI002458A791|nr:MHYT domain-containing protein [Sulfitobacter faviae]
MHSDHDMTLVLLAALLCAFGSWVIANLYRHALKQTPRQALLWYFLTAVTSGIAIWCTHFIAMLAYQPDAPVSFDFGLTFVSLLIAIIGSTLGILIAGMYRRRFTNVIGGVILGLSISAMHYTGMVAYRIEGMIHWDQNYLVASVVLAMVLSIVALSFGGRGEKYARSKMTASFALAIIGLHFTGMAAFHVMPTTLIGGHSNPDEFRLLAMVIAGTAAMIVTGGLFTYFIENRTRMENIVELRQARDEARDASRAKSEFMSVLSHELRTPLTIINGYASFLTNLKGHTMAKLKPNEPISKVHFDELGDQTERYGGRIKSAGDHLLTIINELLDYTSIELNSVKLNRTSFAAGDLLAELAEQFQGLAKEKQAVLEIEYDEFDVFADRGRCKQILINLLGNALKFSSASSIRMRAKQVGDTCRLEVEDNGCGMPAEDLQRIFQAFIQAETASKSADGGTGLGLAISKKLAAAHEGDIRVESTVGIGTKFTVDLPLCASEIAAEEALVAA